MDIDIDIIRIYGLGVIISRLSRRGIRLRKCIILVIMRLIW